MTNSRIFFFADDVEKLLGVGKSSAYGIIKRLNGELEQSGFLTVSGRIPKNISLNGFTQESKHLKRGGRYKRKQPSCRFGSGKRGRAVILWQIEECFLKR